MILLQLYTPHILHIHVVHTFVMYTCILSVCITSHSHSQPTKSKEIQKKELGYLGARIPTLFSHSSFSSFNFQLDKFDIYAMKVMLG